MELEQKGINSVITETELTEAVVNVDILCKFLVFSKIQTLSI